MRDETKNAGEATNRIREALERREEELQTLQGEGRKIIATLAAFAPPFELIEATGGVPLRLLEGGEADFETRGLRLLKNEACSLLKGVLGALSSGSGLRPDAVVVGGACDQLRRAAEVISRDLGLPVFEFSVPRAHGNQGAQERLRHEMEWLGRELAHFCRGAPFDPGALGHRVRAWNRARRAARRLDESRGAGRLAGREALALARSIWRLGPEAFLEAAGTIEASLPPAPEVSPPGVPLLFTGPPVLWGDDTIADFLEASGRGRIAGDVLETGTYPHLEEADENGDPLEALAQRANRFPLGCGFKRPDGAFVEAVRQEARRWGAKGVVYKSLSFCAPWNHQASRFKKIWGLPLLALEGDYAAGQTTRLKTRIEAFLEALS